MNRTEASNKLGTIIRKHYVPDMDGSQLHYDLMNLLDEYGDSMYLYGKKVARDNMYDDGWS